MNHPFFRSLIVAFLFVILHTSLRAQQADSSKTETQQDEVAKLDTEESLEYLGGELWFQMKKRLHLTSEEEEKKRNEKKKKSVVLNIMGIKIEKD